MGYKSRAQQGKFHAMLAQGDIDPAVVHEFDQKTDFSHLPAKVGTSGAIKSKTPSTGASLKERVQRIMTRRGYRPRGRPVGTTGIPKLR